MNVVLLVEDEWLVTVAQSEALSEAGFVVHMANTGSSALDAAETLSLSDCGPQLSQSDRS